MSPTTTMSQVTDLRQVPFHEDEIISFEHDGQPHVAMRRVCENMELSWGSQHRNLCKQIEKFNCTHMTTVGADGKQRELLSMPVTKLPLWLATINPNKIKDDAKRTKIERYQEESAIALHKYWTQGVAVRGDHDGIIEGLSPDVVKQLGGMMKGIVQKHLSGIESKVAESLASRTHALVRDALTVGQVLDREKVPSNGRRSLVMKVSYALRRFSLAENVIPRQEDFGSSRAYVHPMIVVEAWLKAEGRTLIREYRAAKEGQKSLFPVINGGKK